MTREISEFTVADWSFSLLLTWILNLLFPHSAVTEKHYYSFEVLFVFTRLMNVRMVSPCLWVWLTNSSSSSGVTTIPCRTEKHDYSSDSPQSSRWCLITVGLIWRKIPVSLHTFITPSLAHDIGLTLTLKPNLNLQTKPTSYQEASKRWVEDGSSLEAWIHTRTVSHHDNNRPTDCLLFFNITPFVKHWRTMTC